MPLLYPIATIFFILQYWVDKCLILRKYRKPVMYDDFIAKATLSWLWMILAFHIAGFLSMYGISPIVQNHIYKTYNYSNNMWTTTTRLDIYKVVFYISCLVVGFYFIWIVLCKGISRLLCQNIKPPQFLISL